MLQKGEFVAKFANQINSAKQVPAAKAVGKCIL